MRLLVLEGGGSLLLKKDCLGAVLGEKKLIKYYFGEYKKLLQPNYVS